jgi:hypothetical protein
MLSHTSHEGTIVQVQVKLGADRGDVFRLHLNCDTYIVG